MDSSEKIPSKFTTFDKLSQLCRNLETSIKNMHSSTDALVGKPFVGGTNVKLAAIVETMAEIRFQADKCSTPEAEYANLLFQKFIKDIEEIRRKENTTMLKLLAASNATNSSESNRIVSVINDIFDEVNIDTIEGMGTFDKSIFWLRIIVNVLALVVIILINTTATVMKDNTLSGYDFEVSNQ